MLSSNRLRTNSIGAHMYHSRPEGRKYRRTGAKSACFRFLQFGIAWCKVRSSSYWSQSSRRTSNRDRLDIVPRGQLMKRSTEWPEVASQLIREYIYLYGAACPKDGTCVYLIMPTSNTACFQIFLNVLSRKFARQDILLVLDGAPNHRCKELALPNNISLLVLPPYSPELNPKENLWDEIREKFFKNYALKSIDAVRAKLKQAILYIERNPKLVQSITSFPYIVKSS